MSHLKLHPNPFLCTLYLNKETFNLFLSSLFGSVIDIHNNQHFLILTSILTVLIFFTAQYRLFMFNRPSHSDCSFSGGESVLPYYSWPLYDMYTLKILGPGRLLAPFLWLLPLLLRPLIALVFYMTYIPCFTKALLVCFPLVSHYFSIRLACFLPRM